MKTYRLGSADFVHAPGLISWAINGYAFKKDQTHLLSIVADTWSIPAPVADALLSKRVPFIVEDETVVFSA